MQSPSTTPRDQGLDLFLGRIATPDVAAVATRCARDYTGGDYTGEPCKNG